MLDILWPLSKESHLCTHIFWIINTLCSTSPITPACTHTGTRLCAILPFFVLFFVANVWFFFAVVCVRLVSFSSRFSFHHMQEFKCGIRFFSCYFIFASSCCVLCDAHIHPFIVWILCTHPMHKCNTKNGTIITFSLFFFSLSLSTQHTVYKHFAKCDRSLYSLRLFFTRTA